MSKGGKIFLLVLVLAGGGYYYYRSAYSSSFFDQEKITIAGEEYEVYPPESLGKIGCTLRRIPDRKNAAILYVEASNVYEEAKPGGRASRMMRYVAGYKWVSDSELKE